MKILFLLFLTILPSLAKSTFTLRDLPEISYLHRKIDVPTRTPKEIEAAQLLAHNAVEELVAEARKHHLNFPDVRFFHIDLKENKILYVCLEVSGPRLKNVPPEKLMKRPAGKYLSVEYEGLPEDATFGKEITPYLQKKSLRVKRWEAYQYKRSAVPQGMTKIFLIPVGN